MRKLLLGTTALAAAATLTANAALADVSVSGYYEWTYTSTSSNITANDGTKFGSDSEVHFKFSNKTDAGLDIGLTVEMFADGGDSDIEESSLSIAGGFGKVVLGQNDGVGDSLGVAATDLPAEEITQIGTSASISIENGDYVNLSSNANQIAYYLPAMGGLKTGVSYYNSGNAGSADSTEFAFQYAMDAGGAAITIGGATGTTEDSTQDIDSQVIGVKVSSGNITAAVSQSTHEASGSDEESNSAAVQFKVADGMSVTFHTTETDDSSTSEEYTNTGAEVAYTIASGLTAYLNVEDYDYKVGTSSGTADSGTVSKLTIKASF
jgi:outer membrane protein OmpU